MATLEQAEAARNAFADMLAKHGAHAVGVEQVAGGDEWEVVAYVEPGAQTTLPASLSPSIAGKRVTVPIRIRREGRFQLE